MEGKIKVGAVSYLNTKPLLYGLERSSLMKDMDLSLQYPAELARNLKTGSLDLALLPVAALAEIPEARIVGDHCIAANGKVFSVCLFSEVPMEKVESLYLDYQSRTSVRLARILLDAYWNKKVELLPAPEDYIRQISGTRAGVIIGDRALKQLGHFPYVYDLAEAWKEFTGLPFVFAAWVACRSLPDQFMEEFNRANEEGLQNIPEVVAENPVSYFDLNAYYTEHIQYHLNSENRKGLDLFLKLIAD